MYEKTKIAKFIDNSVLTFVCFFLTFVTIKKYTHSNLYAAGIALFVCFISMKILLHFQFSYYNKLGLKKQEIKQIEYTNISFRKLTQFQQTVYLKKLFRAYNVRQIKGFLMLDNNVIVSNQISKSEITVDSLFEIYATIKSNKLNPDEVAIICNKTSQEIFEKQKNFDLKFSFITPEIFYTLTKQFDCEFSYLPQTKTKQNLLLKFKTKLLLKKQAKYFIRCGFLLLLASMLVPYSQYYIISACITLLIGSFCLIFGSKEIQGASTKLLKNNAS